MSATGRGAIRAKNDFYRTPEWCVHAIVPHLGPARVTVDPCAGDGAILGVLKQYHQYVYLVGFDIEPRAPDIIARDALEPGPWGQTTCNEVDLVVMNPPYAGAYEFITRSLSEVAPVNGTVAALLRLNWLGSKKRAAFHKLAPSDVYVLSKRPSFGGASGTDATEYAWFVWGPGRGNRWFIL